MDKYFFYGFYKQAVVGKGERFDKSEGARPRTGVASKGAYRPSSLPSVDPEISPKYNLSPEIRYKSIPKIRLRASRVRI